MANNMITFLGNVTKSVGYSTVDYIKEANPTLTSFAEQNAEFGKSLYSGIKDYKRTIKNTKKNIKKNDYYEATVNLKNNLFEDLKSGKFYNRERIEKTTNEALSSFFDDGDDPFAGFDFDDNDDVDIEFTEDGESNTIALSDTINNVGQGITNGISEATIRSAEYITDSGIRNTNKVLDNIHLLGSHMTNGFGTVNSTIGNLVTFNDKVMKVHVENSAKFYENMTNLQQENNNLLKELVDLNKKALGDITSKKSTSKRTTYEDIVNADGMPDLKTYFKAIKENVEEATSSVTDMMEVFGKGKSNLIHQITASPLKFVTDTVVKKLVPNIIKQSMESFNQSLSGFFGSAMAKLNDMAENSTSAMGKMFGKIFGVKNVLNTNLATDKFKRGPIPWDGEAKKTLFNISDQLGKIISILSGQEQKLFDMNKGTYRKSSELREEYDNLLKTSIRTSSVDFRDEFEEILKTIKMDNANTKKQIREELDNMLQTTFTEGKFFNPRKFNKESAYDYGVYDDKVIKLLQGIFNNMSNASINSLNAGNMSGRQAHTSMINRINEEGGVLTSLNSGIIDKKGKPVGVSALDIMSKKDHLNHDIFYYLQNMTKELVLIRGELQNGNIRTNRRRRGYNKKGRIVNTNRKTNVRAAASIDDYRIEDILRNSETYSDIYEDDNVNARFREAEEERNKQEGYILADANELLNMDDSDASRAIGRAYDKYRKNESNKLKNAKDKTIIDKLYEAGSFGEKLKVFNDGLNDLLGKPAKFMASMISRADNRLFDLLYGTEDEKDPNKRSFAKRLFGGLTDMFGKFNTWLDENIFSRFKETMTKENIHNAASKVANTLGFDLDKTVDGVKLKIFGKKKSDGSREGGLLGDTIEGVKNDFKGVGKEVGRYFREIKNEIYDGLGLENVDKKTKREAQKQLKYYNRFKSFEEGMELGKDKNLNVKIKDAAKVKGAKFNPLAFSRDEVFSDIMNNENATEGAKRRIKAVRRKNNEGDILRFANGSLYVPKTTVATLSEGEAVIPRELNPFYKGKNTSKKQQLQEEKRVADEFFKQYGIKLDRGYADGVDSIEPNDIRKEQTVADRLQGTINKENGKGFRGQVTQGFKNLINGLKAANEQLEFFSGTEEERKEINNNIKKAGKEIETNLHAGITGGILGAGASILTGFGGPLFGALAGSAIGFIKNSDTVQKALFGTDDKKGLLPESMTKAIKKYLPDMTKYGVAGGLTSLLPFIPGGPVAGLIVGSTIGFVKNNDEAKEALFGKDGAFKDAKKIQDNIKKALPNMSVGAIAGLIGGPFGMITNVMLGSAVGYATTTDAFKDAMFGKVDKVSGERRGGVLGSFREHVVDPMKTFVTEGIDSTKKWFKEKVFKPIADAVSPIKKQIGLSISNTFGKVAGFLQDMFSKSIGAPMNKFMESKVFKPFTSLLKFTLKATTHPIKTAIGVPAGIIGAIGNRYRGKHIASGNADYMTADERNEFRQNAKHGLIFRRSGLKRDKFAEFDEQMSNMTLSDLNEINDQIGVLKNFKGGIKNERNNALNSISDAIYNNPDISYSDAKSIMNSVKKGDFASVASKIRRLDLGTLERDSLFNTIRDHGGKLASLDTMESNSTETRAKLYEQLKKKGFKDINDKNLGKYEKLFNKEINARTPEEALEEKQEERHNTIVDLFETAISELRKINDPEYKVQMEIEAKRKIQKENSKRKGAFGLDFGYRDVLSDEEISRRYDDPNYEGSELQHRTDDSNSIFGFTKRIGRFAKSKIDPIKSKHEYDRKKRYFERRNPGKEYMSFDEYLKAKSTETEGGELRANSSMMNNGGDNRDSSFSEDIKKEADEKKKDLNNKEYTTDSSGRPLILTKDDKGEMAIDEQNAGNREVLKEQEKEKQAQYEIADGIKGIGGHIKEWWAKKIHPDSDDEEDHRWKNMFKLIGKIALGTFGGAIAISFLPILDKWWDNTAKPGIANWWDERVAPHVAQFIYNHREGLINTATKLDQIITNTKNFIVSIPTALSNFWTMYMQPLMFGDQPWSVKNIFAERLPEMISNGLEYFLEKIVPAVAKGIVYAAPTVVKSIGNMLKGVFSIGLGKSEESKLTTSAIYDANGNIIYSSGGNGLFGTDTADDIKKNIFSGTAYSNGTGFSGPGSVAITTSKFLGTDAYKSYDAVHGTNYASMDNPNYVAYLQQLQASQGKYTSADGRNSSLVGLMTDSVKDHYYDITRGVQEGTGSTGISTSDSSFINSINQFAEGSSDSDSSYYTGEKYLINDGLGNVISYDPSTGSSYQTTAYNNMNTSPSIISSNDLISSYGYGDNYGSGSYSANNNNYNTEQLVSNAYSQSNFGTTTGSDYGSYFNNTSTGNVDNSVINNNYYGATSTGINSSTGSAINDVYSALSGSKITVEQARNQYVTLSNGNTYTLGQIIDTDMPLGIYNELGEEYTGRDILYYTDLAKYFNYPDLSAQGNVLTNGEVKRTNQTVGSSIGKVVKHGLLLGLTGNPLNSGTNLSYKLFSKIAEKGILPGAVGKKWYGRIANSVAKTTAKGIKFTTDAAYAVGNKVGKKVNGLGSWLSETGGSYTSLEQSLAAQVANIMDEDAAKKAAGDTNKVTSMSEWLVKKGQVDADAVKAAKEATESVTDKSITGAVQKAGKEAAEGAVEGLAKNSSKLSKLADTNIVTKILDKVVDLMKSFVNSRPVQAIFGKVIKKVSQTIDEFIEKLVSGLQKIITSNKLASKIAVKCGKFLTKLNIVLLIADAVNGFLYGVMNANTILGVLDQPNWVSRIIIGLVSALNEVFMCGLLPLDDLVTLGFDIGTKLGWIDGDSDYAAARKEAADAVAQYNMDNGTDYTLEEYQDATATDWYHTAKRTTKNIWKNVVGEEAREKQTKNVYDQYLDNSTSANAVREALVDNGMTFSDEDKRKIVTLYNQEHNTHYSTSDYDKVVAEVQANQEYAEAKSYMYKQEKSTTNLWQKVTRSGGTNTKKYKNSKKIVENYESGSVAVGGTTGATAGIYAAIGKGSGLGSNSGTMMYSGTSIANSGCGPAVAAMLINKMFGTNLSTEDVASLAQSLGYAKNGGTTANFFTDLLSSLGINTSVASDKKSILNSLSRGSAILLGKDNGNSSKTNSPFGKTNHYVLSNGLSSDGKYAYIDDPENPGTTKYSLNNILKGSNLAINVGAGTGLRTNVTPSENISSEEEKLYELANSMQLIMNNTTIMKKAMNRSLSDSVSFIDNIDPDKLFKDDTVKFENGTPEWMKTAYLVLNKITKMPLMIPSLTIYPMKELYTSLVSMTKGINSTTGVRNADKTIQSALNGNITPYSNSYWNDEITGSKDNYIYMIARIGNMLKKIVHAPIIMINNILRSFSKNNITGQLGNMVSGIEASSTMGVVSATSSLSGSGSGIVSQNASDISNMRYGNSTLGESGCAPAAAAMVLGDRGLNYSIQDTAKFATGNNYVNSDGSTSINYFTDIAKANGLSSSFSSNKSEILNNLQDGRSTVLVGSDASNNSKFVSPFGKNNHYVVADGVQNGKVIIRDPELNEARAYDVNTVLKGTKGAVGFNGGLSSSIRNIAGSGIRNILNVSPSNRVKSKVSEDEVKYARSLYPSAVGNIVNADLGAFSPLSIEQINTILNNKTTGPFRGQGNVFEAASRASGLNPLYIIAHAASESAWGTSEIAKNKNNYFGIAAYDGSASSSATKFSNFSDGIISGAKWIAANYYNKYGQKTLNSMLYNGGTHEYATDSMWDYIIGNIMYGLGTNNYTNYTTNPYSDSFVSSGITTYGTDTDDASSNDNSLSGIISNLSDIFGMKGHFSKAFGFYSGDSEENSTLLNSVGFSGSDDSGNDIVQTARQYIGKTKYVYGSTNMPEEADCSSFIQYVFKKVRNVNIGRTTKDQLKSKELTDVTTMQPGDIILFGKNGTVKHVGIYSGGNNMIHNSYSKKMVIEVSLLNYNEYSGMKVMAIRRHVGTTGTAYIDQAASKITKNNTSSSSSSKSSSSKSSKSKSSSNKKSTSASNVFGLGLMNDKLLDEQLLYLVKKTYGWDDADAKKYISYIKRDMEYAKKMNMTATEFYAFYERHKKAIKEKKMTTYEYYKYLKKQINSASSGNNRGGANGNLKNTISARGSGLSTIMPTMKKINMNQMINSAKSSSTNTANNNSTSRMQSTGIYARGTSTNNMNAKFMLSVIELLKSINTNTQNLIKLDKIASLISKLNVSGKGSGNTKSSGTSSSLNDARISAVETGLKLLLQETISSSNDTIDPSLDYLANELESLVGE